MTMSQLVECRYASDRRNKFICYSTSLICYPLTVREVLVCWIGHTDLRAPEESEAVGVGPVAQALGAGSYDDAFLLTDHERETVRRYVPWLEAHDPGCTVHVLHERLTGPTEFGEIYTAAVRRLRNGLGRQGRRNVAHLPPESGHSGHGRSVDHPREDPLPRRADRVVQTAWRAHRLRTLRHFGGVSAGSPAPARTASSSA